ncbi:MAG TPA: aldo/keto reductase [Patescibacteria group bacterium]|jgi:aryl-alcohol dehydrogenase-like predicted oxidoreductase|nr:aldo/keto reductase [Patescibacteria group bacterium]
MTTDAGNSTPPARIAGSATAEGTARYKERFRSRLSEDHHRQAGGLWLSSVGIGTYLGEADQRDDAGYRDSVVAAARLGCNVVDSAINYRFQRSERNVGDALRSLFSAGFSRDELVVATKGGFIPFDGDYPADPAGWVSSRLFETGIASRNDVVAGCHIMTPRYLETQIEWSRGNLGLQTLDIYYLHNPETQLQHVERHEFLSRIKAAFETLERNVAAGVIGIYGVATWDGFRLPPDHPGHLSLNELRVVAEQVGGSKHHFRAIQLPVNLVMSEACLLPTQMSDGRRVSLLDAAADAGMVVMASGSLLQGKIIPALGADFARMLPGTRTNAQRGIQVVRSVPGVATSLVGMKNPAHVEENLGVAALPRLAGEEAIRILEACTRR